MAEVREAAVSSFTIVIATLVGAREWALAVDALHLAAESPLISRSTLTDMYVRTFIQCSQGRLPAYSYSKACH